jgi:YegS/Rv2252/BmrU family lipid kinase
MLFFIVNPVSGHGRSLRIMDKLCKYLNAQGVEYKTAFSVRPGHIVKIARDAAAAGYETIVAVGGDGTIREALEGMHDTDSALGFIPAGSGNDFVKSLGIPKDPMAALNIILAGERRTIDAGQINRRMFLNSATIGFDAEVVARAQRLPALRGFASYFIATIITLLRLRRKRVTLEREDGAVSHHDVLLIAVCNGRYYGGGFKVAPQAELDDGLFDVILAEGFTRLRALRMLPKYVRGTHLNKPARGLSHFRCKSLKLRTHRPVTANADGEISMETELSFAVKPGAVHVVVPAQAG